MRAKERYEACVREQAEKQCRAAEEKAEAAAKAEAERIRRQKAVEEIQARQVRPVSHWVCMVWCAAYTGATVGTGAACS